jgi:hypothetical protein
MDSLPSCVIFSRERRCTPNLSRTKPPYTPRRVFRRHIVPDASSSPLHHHKLGRADQSHVCGSTCVRCDSFFVLSAPVGFAYFAEAEAEAKEPKSRSYSENWRHHYQVSHVSSSRYCCACCRCRKRELGECSLRGQWWEVVSAVEANCSAFWWLSLQAVRSSFWFALCWPMVVSLHKPFNPCMTVTRYTVTCVEGRVQSVECSMLTARRGEVRDLSAASWGRSLASEPTSNFAHNNNSRGLNQRHVGRGAPLHNQSVLLCCAEAVAACGCSWLPCLLETKRASQANSMFLPLPHHQHIMQGGIRTTKASVQPRRSFMLMLWSTKYHDLGQHHRHRRPAANTVRTCHDAPLHPYLSSPSPLHNHRHALQA